MCRTGIHSNEATSPLILVCFALRNEARFFSPPGPTARVQVLHTGIGKRNAIAAVTPFLAREKPTLVLTCGFAGGLRPGLPAGSILFSSDPGVELHNALLELGAHPGTFLCADRIATTVREKQSLWRDHALDAVEMESGAIRELCLQAGVGSATVRVISDTAEQDLPLEFNELMTKNWQLDGFKLARAVIASPRRIPGLLELQRQTARAARALGSLLTKLVRKTDRPSASSSQRGQAGLC